MKKRLKKINYGFKPDIRKEEDYFFGSSPLSGEVLQEDGQWTDFLPPEEIQRKQFETYDCTAFGTLNCLEILFLRKFGQTINKSDRALGIMSGTDPESGGNSPSVVAQTLHSQGCIDDELLPFSDDLKTVEDFYSPKPLPVGLQKEAKKWLNQYSLGYEQVFRLYEEPENKLELIKEALKYSPLGISVYAWWEKDGVFARPNGASDNHWVCAYGWEDDGVKVFDSYDQTHKLVDWGNIGSAILYRLTKKEKVSFWSWLKGLFVR